MKRPAFQFYPADWRKDSALQSCSIGARGLWIELMCIAHECETYGVLAINGKPMSQAQLSRLVGEPEKALGKHLIELEQAGVFSRNEAGAIYSRRMVEDERIRNIRAEAGRLGGNPNLVKQKDNHADNQTGKQSLTPSSSSSSSTTNTHSAGALARAIKEAGIGSVNPGDPRLLALVEVGATPEEMRSAASEATAKGKGFAYALAIAEGRRKDASRLASLPTVEKTPEVFT